MVDMDTRDELLRAVRRRLVDARFASRFTQVAADGSRPIVVAMREDSLNDLSDQVLAMGGAANVVTPLLDGAIVFSMCLGDPADGTDVVERAELDAEGCTVGLLIQRLIGQGGGTAVYAFEQSDHCEARATDARMLQPA